VAVVRVAVPAPEVKPLAWLAAQTEQKRGYWADRDGACEVALVGEADEIKGMAAQDVGAWDRAVTRRLEQSVGEVRYYGGFRFGPWHPTDPSWQPFGAYRFILPRFEVLRSRATGTELAMNLVRDAAGHWPSLENIQLESAPAEYTPPALPTVLGRRDEPDTAAWAAGVSAALDRIRSGSMAKIVLARRALLALSGPADPLALLHGLQRQTGRCFQFCGTHGAGFSFVGASPELLYRRSGRDVDSEAVAGTRPRGASDLEDRALADDLLRHPKEAEEHRLVRDRIVHDLSGVSQQVASDPAPSLLKLGRVQHLRTAIRATLRPGVTRCRSAGAPPSHPRHRGRTGGCRAASPHRTGTFRPRLVRGPGGLGGSPCGRVCRGVAVWTRGEIEPALVRGSGYCAGVGCRSGGPRDRVQAGAVFAPVQVMIHDAPNLNALWSAVLAEELVRLGVTTVAVAPGSRSTPLALAVIAHRGLQTQVHWDERGLGFFALGHARATGRPVAVITTSGTAVANLAPAVAEAALDHVPLLLLTADRPPELRDTAANQTMDQNTLFGSFLRWRFDMPCPGADLPAAHAVDHAGSGGRARAARAGGSGPSEPDVSRAAGTDAGELSEAQSAKTSAGLAARYATR
jgi:menaquinone-specific isochorismate synthase